MQSLIVEYAGIPVEVNEEGFLLDADQWTPEVAQAIAREVGIGELTDLHWKVLTFCREDATQQGTPPGLPLRLTKFHFRKRSLLCKTRNSPSARITPIR